MVEYVVISVCRLILLTVLAVALLVSAVLGTSSPHNAGTQSSAQAAPNP